MISTKGRYALRVMIDLAECEKEEAEAAASAEDFDAGNTDAPAEGSRTSDAAPSRKNGAPHYVALKDVAERQGISKKYLEIIVKDLVAAGFIRGTRGKSGGYVLTRKPEDYTVQEILDSTEGEFAAVACLAKDAAKCPRSSYCKTLPMWKEYAMLTHDFFYNKSLKELAES